MPSSLIAILTIYRVVRRCRLTCTDITSLGDYSARLANPAGAGDTKRSRAPVRG